MWSISVAHISLLLSVVMPCDVCNLWCNRDQMGQIKEGQHNVHLLWPHCQRLWTHHLKVNLLHSLLLGQLTLVDHRELQHWLLFHQPLRQKRHLMHLLLDQLEVLHLLQIVPLMVSSQSNSSLKFGFLQMSLHESIYWYCLYLNISITKVYFMTFLYSGGSEHFLVGWATVY